MGAHFARWPQSFPSSHLKDLEIGDNKQYQNFIFDITMGLSIHYKGRIRNYSQVNELTEEVQDICENMGWPYRIWKPENTNTCKQPSKFTPEDLKGIFITPAKCETLTLTFLPDGRLRSIENLLYNDKDLSDTELPFIHTKTQFAGLDVHIAIMKLLFYLKEKYFNVLEVIDEGMYWETKDEKVLIDQFEKYEAAFKSFEDMLTGFESMPDETPESQADRLEKLLSDKLPPKGFKTL